MDFKKNYKDFPDFESIPIIQELIVRDNKEWIRYKSSDIKESEKHMDDQTKEDNIDSTLDEIQKFLKLR
ncbi:MAG: hypothetical protein ACFE9I_15925 [Candidatus Hermodarchaeota archaeon]